MNIGTSQYDPELQMFTDQTREPDLGRLRFMRWLVEHGRLEHGAEGVSEGAFALAPCDAPSAA